MITSSEDLLLLTLKLMDFGQGEYKVDPFSLSRELLVAPKDPIGRPRSFGPKKDAREDVKGLQETGEPTTSCPDTIATPAKAPWRSCPTSRQR